MAGPRRSQFLVASVFALLAACSQSEAPTSPEPRVVAASDVAAGEYLMVVGGCNDCHTAGWSATGGDIPPDDRLTGSPVGFKGPWGVTYASNLRLTASEMSEDEWVEMLRTRLDLPPMPWFNLTHASESDLRAMHAYLVALGPKGDPTPPPAPLDEEFDGPFIDFDSAPPAASPEAPSETDGER